jgi:hypothetical protein
MKKYLIWDFDGTLTGLPAILVRSNHPEAPYRCSELSQVLDILNRMCEGGLHRDEHHEPTISAER